MRRLPYGAGWGELGSQAESSSSQPHRTGAAQHRLRTLSQTRVLLQTAPLLTPNGRRHQGHQPLLEEHVGEAALGLAHRVGAEWREAHVGCSRTGRTRCAKAYASARTVLCDSKVRLRLYLKLEE